MRLRMFKENWDQKWKKPNMQRSISTTSFKNYQVIRGKFGKKMTKEHKMNWVLDFGEDDEQYETRWFTKL